MGYTLIDVWAAEEETPQRSVGLLQCDVEAPSAGMLEWNGVHTRSARDGGDAPSALLDAARVPQGRGEAWGYKTSRSHMPRAPNRV